MSHREYLTRLAWLDLQWNKPSRTDHYLMRIVQALVDKKGKRKLSDFVLPFKAKKQAAPQDSKKSITGIMHRLTSRK